MYWHFAAYSESLGSVTDSDVNAADDQVLGFRNSHLIVTEPYELRYVYGSSTTLTRARFGNQALSQKGREHIWPLGRTDTIPSRPRLMDFGGKSRKLPINEEWTIEATTDAAGPVVANFGLVLTAPPWTRNLPAGQERFITRATFTPAAGAASTWGAFNNLTMERDLLNGVYAVVGAAVVNAGAFFFRFRFPDQGIYENKQLRPGGLITNAVGDFPWEEQFGGLGEWGRFHTFSLPQIQIFGAATVAATEVRLDLIYLGESRSLLNRM